MKIKRLADFFQRQKVSLEVEGFSNPVEFLVESGYLARPVFSSLFYDSGEDLSSRDLADIERGMDIPTRILERLAQDEQRNLGIIHRTEQIAKEHRRIILFAASVDSCKSDSRSSKSKRVSRRTPLQGTRLPASVAVSSADIEVHSKVP